MSTTAKTHFSATENTCCKYELQIGFALWDKEAVCRWAFCYGWIFLLFYVSSSVLCSSVMTDFLWSRPSRKHVAKIKPGCFADGSLLSASWRTSVSDGAPVICAVFIGSFFLCVSQCACSSLSLHSFPPKENMKKGRRRVRILLSWMCCVFYTMHSKHWVPGLG